MTPDMEKEMTTMCNLSLNISEEAMNEGLQKGIKIGEDSALNRTAIRLLTMGFSVDDVAKGTGLSVEAVEKLKESMEQKG
jgi:predicted transposase/invertase (TIGR01784 family)